MGFSAHEPWSRPFPGHAAEGPGDSRGPVPSQGLRPLPAHTALRPAQHPGEAGGGEALQRLLFLVRDTPPPPPTK